MNLRWLFCTLLLLISVAAKANHCASLSLQLVNQSNGPCHLRQQIINHGYFNHLSAPLRIAGGQYSAAFSLHQTVYGPDIELSYLCGSDKFIHIRAQQNFCFLTSGNVVAQVLSQKGPVTVTFQPIKAGTKGYSEGHVRVIIA